jgi:threonine dehydratase
MKRQFEYFSFLRVVVPLCGGNIDTTVLGRVLEHGLVADKRLLKVWLIVR